MHIYRLALIGFGNVGQGFARLISEQGEQLRERFGFRVSIVAICDLLKGSVYDPDGLDTHELLASIHTVGTLENVKVPSIGWSVSQTIRESNADIVVELSYTDLHTGEPMSGTPALKLGQELLAATTIERIQGIFNGTTNSILTRMEQGFTYEEALAEAQRQGYAEADPTADVEGYDTAAKVMILAHLFMNTPLSLDEIDRSGITHLTREAIAQTRDANERWKFLGSVERAARGVKARVGLVRLPSHHLLASVQGATNAIMYHTDVLGEVALVGPGAGRVETAFALVCDLIALHRKRGRNS